MNTISDSALNDYAAKLLVGTPLDPNTAAAVAAHRQPATGPVADALRDGWASADTGSRP